MMRSFVSRTLGALLLASLAGCSGTPQWSEPLFKSQAATPSWLEGLWEDSSGTGFIRLKAQGNRFEYVGVDERFVFLGSASVTRQNDELFLSMRPKDGKYLASDPKRVGRIHAGSFDRLGKVPLSGYYIRYLDRVSDDEIKLTEIDYDDLFASLKDRKERLGIDLCRKVPLSAEALQRQRHPDPSPCQEFTVDPAHPEQPPPPTPRCQAVSEEANCDLLDTNTIMDSRGGLILARSDNSETYHRMKAHASSGGN
jgi:hypothetical protein